MNDLIKSILPKIHHQCPLILNITNEVTSDFIANGLLSLGAAPVMSRALQEAEELVQLANAVVINPGTLDDGYIRLSHKVCAAANQFRKPIILDPVGAGASRYRTLYNQQLLEQYSIAIIRGNASEIMALAGATLQTRGVDSIATTDDAIPSAKGLAEQFSSTVAVSGACDAIVNFEQFEQFCRGSGLMPKVTGTGCLLSAIIAAFHAVHANAFEAACAAAFYYCQCGEHAELNARGPGTFKVQFIDALAALGAQ